MGFTFEEETERQEKLKDCTTVEEVEALRCAECAKTGHWGWCDLPWIYCRFKDKIKEILGEANNKGGVEMDRKKIMESIGMLFDDPLNFTE